MILNIFREILPYLGEIRALVAVAYLAVRMEVNSGRARPQLIAPENATLSAHSLGQSPWAHGK